MASERLAAHILRFAGYTSVDPSHPLGGPDGLKDIVCLRDGAKWIGAAYFPRGQHSFSAIVDKFKHDVDGVAKNEAEGIAFVTNQELALGEREKLVEEARSAKVDLFHLERIASILDDPVCYGFRLEYLDIEMTKEEQLAFMEAMYQRVEDLRLERELMLSVINTSEALAEEYRKTRQALESPAEAPEGPHYVTPLYVQSAISPVIGPSTGDRLHRCSVCGYGFLVEGLRYGAITIAAPGSSAAVACPKCGNVDSLYGSFQPWRQTTVDHNIMSLSMS